MGKRLVRCEVSEIRGLTRLELLDSALRHLARAANCLTGRRYGHKSMSGALDFVGCAWASFRSIFKRGK